MLMLGQRCRLGPKIKTTLVQFIMFAGTLCLQAGGGPGAVVKAACLKVGEREFEPHSKKQNVFSTLTREDSILWGASVTER